MSTPNRPVILNPNNGIDYTTSETSVVLAGVVSQIDPILHIITEPYIVTKITINGSDSGVVFTPDSTADQLAWSYSATLSEGENVFNIQAFNADGLSSAINIFRITVISISAPTINYPNNGEDFETDINSFNFHGTIDSQTKEVIFKQNGVGLPGVLVIPEQSSWSILNVSLSNGDNDFEVLAENAVGDQSEATTQKLTYIPSGLPLPPPTITYPSTGNFETREEFVTLRGVTDPSTEEIKYSENGSPFTDFNVTYYPGDKDWEIRDISLQEGLNVIVVQASNTTENASTTIQITYTPPPDLFITIDYPQEGEDFSTNIDLQDLAGSVSPNAEKVTISIRGLSATEDGVIHTPGDSIWSYPDLRLQGDPTAPDGINTIVVQATDKFGNVSDPATINIKLVSVDDIDLIVSPPTGISTKSFRDAVEVIWSQNLEQDIVGYNVYYSLNAGGGSDGYVKANSDLVTIPAYSEEVDYDVDTAVTQTGNVRTTVTQEVFQDINFFSFTPDKNPDGTNFELGVPVYFVLTAVSYDTANKTEVESLYSVEVSAEPIVIDKTVRDLTPRSMSDILANMISNIFSKDQAIDFSPGSVVRDIFLDPPAEEFRKLYVILDFVSTSQSFLTLRQFDDPNETGDSIAVEDSADKQLLADALGISDDETQTLINEQFDKLAANFNVYRQDAQPSQVEVTIYTTTEPSEDIIVRRGAKFLTGGSGESVSFTSLSQAEIRVASLNSFYNRNERRWEVKVPAQSDQAGVDYNVAASTITIVASGVTGNNVRATNELSASFGTDQESNSDLADRAALALVGVDSGTRGGYLKTVYALPQVRQAKVISAGNKYMERDFDDVRDEHIGGKVDIYVQGEVLYSYEETFSFNYPRITDGDSDIVSVSLMQFQPRNDDLSPDTPIFEVLEVKNVSRNLSYSLANYQVIGGSVIDLDETDPLNQQIGLDKFDTVKITYRYRTNLQYTPENQPIDEIISVVGDLSGDLGRNYNFYKQADPLLYGFSELAEDSIEIFFDNAVPLTEVQEILRLPGTDSVSFSNINVLDGSIIPGNATYSINTVTVQNTSETIIYQEGVDYQLIPGNFTIPPQIARFVDGSIPDDGDVLVKYYTKGSGLPVADLQQVIDEEMSLAGESYVETTKVGVFDESITVMNVDKTKTYIENLDYQVDIGDNLTATRIKRLTNGNIPNGSIVKVSYKCGENITLRYSTNQLIHQAQQEVDEMRHVTADVLVKSAIQAPVDINVTVVIDPEGDQNVIEGLIRTAISQFINQLPIASRVYESDIISLIEQVENVNYIEWSTTTSRLNKMARADESLINRESIEDEYTSTFIEDITLTGALPTALSNSNVELNSIEIASLDGSISYVRGRDFDVLYGSTLLPPKIVRISSGNIPDGGEVRVTYISSLFGTFLPPIIVTDESHVLSTGDLVDLNNSNVETSSIVVRSSDLSTVYTNNVDYGIIPGDVENPAQIYRITAGAIPDGGTVLVSYSANPISNNPIIISNEPHQIILSNPVSLNNSNVDESTIVVTLGSNTLTENTDYGIISGTVTTPPKVFGIPGGAISDGDVIFVSYTTLPFGEYERDRVISYITRDPVLAHATQDNGGDQVQVVSESLDATPKAPGGNGFKFNPAAIFEDQNRLTLVASDELVDTGRGQGYIRGDGRIVVSMVSDDPEDRPENHIYKITYIVFNESGSKNIITASLEYPTLNDLILTFITDDTQL